MTKYHPLACAIGMLLLAGQNFHANAQATAADVGPTQDLETVTVTGSHIKRAQIEGVGPVTVIDADGRLIK